MTARISTNTIVGRKRSKLSTEVDGERVILDPDEGLYFSLNAVGSHVWTLLETPTKVELLIEELIEHYEVDPEHCRTSIIQLLEDLNQFSLIDIEGESGT